MVARSGRYYGTSFNVHQGVTQGVPISPTTFKMVVDVVICHWVTLVSGEELGTNGFGWDIQWLAGFFYSDDGILALPIPSHLQ